MLLLFNADLAGRIGAVAVSSLEHPHVNHPSPGDSATWVASLEQAERHLTTCAMDTETFMAGLYQPAELNQELQEERDRLATVHAIPRHFGSVLCTSGLATYVHEEGLSHLDWALIEVDTSRLPDDLSHAANVS